MAYRRDETLLVVGSDVERHVVVVVFLLEGDESEELCIPKAGEPVVAIITNTVRLLLLSLLLLLLKTRR